MDYETAARELIRALRGRRSQTAFSKRLGYRSNVVSAWESGRAFPTASAFFTVLERSGRKLSEALAAFYRLPSSASAHDLTSERGVAAFLDDLRGRTPVIELARSAERSRFAVARWLKGDAEPRLPDFLRLVQTASLRLLDFIACFVDPSALPSLAAAWRNLESARRAAIDMPWSQAVLRVIELEDYRKLRRHRPGFIAERLQISREEEQRCLALLLETGQLRREGARLRLGASLTVDTRGDRQRSQRVKAFWTNVALERLQGGAEGTFSYNLFSVSRADLVKIQELYRAYFRELRQIVAASEPAECIVLTNVHLFELGPSPLEVSK
jgi:transcriptional regulator with XRE-family HTH domain